MNNQKISLDIGCGDRMRIAEGCIGYGIDIKTRGDNILNVDACIESFPLEDNSVSHVFAYDFLEHIPTLIYLESTAFFPRIHFMNEVWRVMETGATFESRTPFFNPDNPRQEWCQDPTHCIPWSKITFNYFSNLGGEWDRLRGIYGIEARFEVAEMRDENSHLFVKLKK